MFADIPLYSESDWRFRHVFKADDIEIIVKDRVNPSEFETDTRRKIK